MVALDTSIGSDNIGSGSVSDVGVGVRVGTGSGSVRW